jgi:hypothetical protein
VKALNAQAAAYAALVIVDNADADLLSPPGLGDADVAIPVFMVAWATGELLREHGDDGIVSLSLHFENPSMLTPPVALDSKYQEYIKKLNQPVITDAIQSCENSLFSSVSCWSNSPFTCTFCNLYMDASSGQFIFLVPKGDKTLIPASIWYPIEHAPFRLFRPSKREADSELLKSLASVHIEPTPTFAVPTGFDNYCHAMNDVIVPLFWLIRERQKQTGSLRKPLEEVQIHRSAVKLFLLPKEGQSISAQGQRVDATQTCADESQKSSINFGGNLAMVSDLLSLFTVNKPLSYDSFGACGHAASSRFVKFQEMSAGASGLSNHINGAYNWHRRRFIHPLIHPEKVVAHNLDQLRTQLSLKGSPPADSTPPVISIDLPRLHKRIITGHILVVNRKGIRRAFGGADTLVELLTERFGSTAVYSGRVVYFEDFKSVAELATALSGAVLLISPHGAGLTNMLYMAPGAVVLELLPYRCQRVAVFYRTLADRLLLGYSMWQPASHDFVPSLDAEDEEWAFQRRELDEEQCPRTDDRAAWADVPFNIAPLEVADLAEQAIIRAASRIKASRMGLTAVD